MSAREVLDGIETWELDILVHEWNAEQRRRSRGR